MVTAHALDLGLVRTRQRRRRQSRLYDDIIVIWVQHPMHDDVITFCRHRLVRTVSLVSMQSIHDNKLK